ncbi:MAG: sirohydrochlorin cobaltochelatase, partial [Selenomonadaceae bacterium]|nr:sirohydrochlorin cobaltochelatase [Selenomonadaceae bacterium]
LESLNLPAYKKGTAILLMAHGTPDPSNAYYSVMQEKLRRMKRSDVHIYTVEGWPRLDDWAGKLKMHKVKKIILMPLMMVAGDHANNDMAGDEDDSHKVILEKMGFKVETRLTGLGENKKIREIFVERANEALDALTK